MRRRLARFEPRTVADLIGRYRRLYPGIQVRVLESETLNDVVTHVRTGACGLGIGHLALVERGLVLHPLGEQELLLVFPPSQPVSQREPVPLETLAHTPSWSAPPAPPHEASSKTPSPLSASHPTSQSKPPPAKRSSRSCSPAQVPPSSQPHSPTKPPAAEPRSDTPSHPSPDPWRSYTPPTSSRPQLERSSTKRHRVHQSEPPGWKSAGAGARFSAGS